MQKNVGRHFLGKNFIFLKNGQTNATQETQNETKTQNTAPDNPLETHSEKKVKKHDFVSPLRL